MFLQNLLLNEHTLYANLLIFNDNRKKTMAILERYDSTLIRRPPWAFTDSFVVVILAVSHSYELTMISSIGLSSSSGILGLL